MKDGIIVTSTVPLYTTLQKRSQVCKLQDISEIALLLRKDQRLISQKPAFDLLDGLRQSLTVCSCPAQHLLQCPSTLVAARTMHKHTIRLPYRGRTVIIDKSSFKPKADPDHVHVCASLILCYFVFELSSMARDKGACTLHHVYPLHGCRLTMMLHITSGVMSK